MGLDEKVVKLEKMAAELETEKNFDNVVAKFAEAAGLAKQLISEVHTEKGKVLEIIKDVDNWIAKELNTEA